MKLFQPALLLLSAALLVSSCSVYSKVSERRPRFLPIPPGAGLLAKMEKSLESALKRDREKPLDCIACCLAAADVAAAQLRESPQDPAALRDYNFAIGRIFATIRSAKLDPWTHPLRVSSPEGEYVLAARPDKRPQWNPAFYEFIPADELDITGTYMTSRSVKPGLGAPLVAVRREAWADAAAEFAQPRAYYGVTAVARFTGHRCEISFEDPLAGETVRMGGRAWPLAADFTAPLALMLSEINPKKLELMRLLRPGSTAETAHIVRLQPFDPEKTTVLVVHGLADSPATWAPMLNRLRNDPDIRKRYQFWFYGYPSGFPYPHSAAILRRELDAALKKFPQRKPMVLIGHSMGGMISRLMITDAGEKIWLGMFGKPPSQVSMPPETKKLLVDGLIFNHRPEVGRAIFIAAPHKGSDMAGGWIGRLGSKLIRLPQTLVKLGGDVRSLMTSDPAALSITGLPNSVDTLAKNNRFVRAVGAIPVRRDIPFHSIIGDRGKGDSPESSDGVVPYWSSHMEGAVSELIVPSNHSAHQNDQAIAEVRRILLRYR